MKALNTTFLSIALAFGAFAGYSQAPSPDGTDQDQTQSGHWRKATDPPPAQPSLQQAAPQPAENSEDRTMSGPDTGQEAAPPPANDQDQQAPPPPANRGWQTGPGQPSQQGGWSRFGDRPMPPPRRPMPPTMTLPAGTWVTFRVNQPLSSDRNQTGDAFMGTLAAPLVMNGLVLANRGQTVSGRVVEAQKAGRVSGTSRLGLELTAISLADGQQVNVHTQMVERRGPTSYGRDAAAIGATTVTGAAIGAAVNGGVGAGVGAAAGVVASTVGVMLTRGRPTVVYPEQVFTFSLVNPVTLTADFNSEAFQPVTQRDYQQSSLRTYGPQGYGQGYGPGYAPPPGYYGSYGYGYPYPYPYYGPYYYGAYSPWFWGPGIGIGFYGGGFYGRGFYGGGFRGGGRR
ncbi:MAG: hypothetical protein ABSF98_18275 [Bryobacteraceae bacterium]|jgi:hypothetical protein